MVETKNNAEGIAEALDELLAATCDSDVAILTCEFCYL